MLQLTVLNQPQAAVLESELLRRSEAVKRYWRHKRDSEGVRFSANACVARHKRETAGF